MSSNIIVDCTWPCPGGSNDNACVLTETSLQCQPKRDSQWLWTDPNLSPQYDGEPARLHQPCITVPLPHLPTTVYSFQNGTQSTVRWPPLDQYHPMDQYLSDCDARFYCERGACIHKLSLGEPCVSTNQCRAGICNSDKRVCQPFPSSNSPASLSSTALSSSSSSLSASGQQNHQQEQSPNSVSSTINEGPWTKPEFTTGHLVGVIIAVVVLLFAVLLFYIYRRKKKAGRLATTEEASNDNDNNNKNSNNNSDSYKNKSSLTCSTLPKIILEDTECISPLPSSCSTLPLSHTNHPHTHQPSLLSASMSMSSSSSSPSVPPASPSSLHSSLLPTHINADVTPSVQQQQLQFQFQRQHSSSSSSGPSTTSVPPPYSP